MGKINDLTNKQYGYLIALHPTDKRINGRVVWKCKCACGEECEVISSNLTSGRTKSCGCQQYKTVAKHYREKAPNKGDIINGTEVLDIEYRPDYRGFNECYIFAKCKFCGSNYWVKKTLLSKGGTKSCGCCRNSIGEATIEKILKDNNIPYEREKTFKDCFFSNPHNKCRFDFYINNEYLIEYDGIQHSDDYKSGTSTWFDNEIIKEIKERDNYKNTWCNQNNIPLIRIPHNKLETLCLNDLLLSTSNYLLGKEI